ncbi:MAG TPA: bifunctional diguanylate cyclase/phosphodiesterase [Steroidobacteraceae bacterium]|nr:bifunctional diguanylate cyclase/phosphodiesterase [Steroidobacteraceae bacterium]
MTVDVVPESRWRRLWRKLRAAGPATLAAAVIATALGVATRAGENAAVAAQRAEVGTSLMAVLGRVRDAVNTLELDTRDCAGTEAAPPIRWRGEPPADEAALAVDRAVRRALSRQPGRRVYGPFPAPDGADYLVAAHVAADGATCLSGTSIAAVMREAGVSRFAGDSVDVRIADAAERVLFESRRFATAAPVRASIEFGAARWSAEAQPRAGWGDVSLPGWTLTLFFGALAGIATYLLQRRVDNQRSQIDVLYARLRGLSRHLDDVLARHDATEQRALALAQLDGGTGLPNRQSTIQALDLHLSHARSRGSPALTVFVVQLASLPEIEKALGRSHLHHAMREAASRLTALEGIAGHIGRIGDIELAFWLDIESTSMAAETLAARAAIVLGEPFEMGKSTAHVSFGIGLTSQSGLALRGEELLEQAAAAAEDATRHHAGAWRRFEPGTRARKIDQLRLETELRHALEGEGLMLHYQPIIEFDSQRLVGFEALIRWQHPLRGLMPPAAFLPVAEHAQLLLEIDRWVMRQAILQAKQWDLDLSRDYFISINISPQHFARPALVDELDALLREHRVAPERVRLEIVENALVTDMETAISVANALRERHIRLSLDDFGTGYSSLGYLRSLPLDAIKVDRFFVERMVTDTRDFGLVKTIIDLARYLEVSCLVEGVSTNEQHELLSVLTPDYAQGNLYSKAVPAARAEQLLRSREELVPEREMAS